MGKQQMKGRNSIYVPIGVCFVLSPLIYMLMSIPVLSTVSMVYALCMLATLIVSISNLVRWKLRYKSTAMPSRRMIALHFLIFLFFGFSVGMQALIINKKARDEVRRFLDSLDIDRFSIQIDGIEIIEKEKIIEGLRNVQGSTVKPSRIYDVKCEIIGKEEKLELILCRANIEENFFWILYPKYYFTTRNEIGGFYSDALEEIMQGLLHEK
jgi:hypothetical protein